MRATKDSGVDWLGEIPTDWEVSRIGACVTERRETVSDTDFPALSVTKKGVVPQLDSAAKSDNSDGRKLIRKDDFVINSRSDRKGSSGVSDLDGSCSVVYTVLQLKRFLPAFAHHLFRSQPFQEEFYRWGTGIVDDLWSTRYSSMKQIPVPVPDLEEQRRIADFLDRETAKIDALIAKQEQLITTLDERISATVSAAIERGEIETRAPILGVNFDQWRQSRLRHLVSLNPSPKSLLGGELSKQVNFLPMNAIGDEGELDLQRFEVASELAGSYSFFMDGDVLMAKVTPCFENGKGAVVSGTLSGFGFATTEVTVLRPGGQLSAEFLYYLLHTSTFMNLASSEMTGAGGLKRVPDSFLRNYRFCLPPLEEQKAIVHYLEERLGELRSLRTKSTNLIDVIRERRQALISAAVTGKLEVSDGYS